MASREEVLLSALDYLAEAIRDASESIKPDYKVDDQSVSWSSHLVNLVTSYERIDGVLRLSPLGGDED